MGCTFEKIVHYWPEQNIAVHWGRSGKGFRVHPLEEIPGDRYKIEELETLIEEYRRTEEQLRRNHDTQAVINALLSLSLEEIPFHDLLQRCLSLLLSIQWLSFESRGAIFLVEEDPEILVLKVANGLEGLDRKVCSEVPFGQCLCGKAALAGEILHVSSDDARHERKFDGMLPHGHYCIPIQYADRVLGVINIFVDAEHQRDPAEEEFLVTIARTLAGIVVRRRTEEALRKSEKKLRNITSNLGEGIFVLDAFGRLVFMNPEAERLLGVSEEALLFHEIDDLVFVGGEAEREVKDESPFRQVLRSGMKCSSEDALFHRRDGTLLPVAYVSTPFMEKGKVTGLITAFRDISERKRLEKELLKSQKDESLGILAGGVAHDFNNLLTAIWGNINLAKIHIDPEDEIVYERLTGAEEAVRRAKDLTQQLLIFARGSRPVRKLISSARFVYGAVSFALSGSNVRPSFHFDEDLKSFEIDEGLMNQVIHNLVVNARDAMPEGGEIRIHCENSVVRVSDDLPLEDGDYVKISIQDPGTGIEKENLPRIFEPFFTTKPEGNGLGLATSYAIVRKHDGYITVDSDVGAGTTFTIYLPASSRTVVLQGGGGEIPFQGRGKILVMDDEEMIRAVAGQMLTRIGYGVEFAANGEEAIEYFEEARMSDAPFDAVLLDLTIPGGLGGLKVIERLREIDPDVIAIVSSGYSDDPVMADYEKYGFQGALPKPYKIFELSEVLHEVIHTE